jgi:16S rRNA (cytosine967-C5)-methyltransferase
VQRERHRSEGAQRGRQQTPQRRFIQPSIDLLDQITASSGSADRVTANFLRSRPWLAGRERGDTLHRVDDVLRHLGRLDWWIARAAHGLPPSSRLRVLAHLALAEGQPAPRIAALFAGGRHMPEPLGGREESFIAAVAGQGLLQDAMPLPIRAAFPAWLEPTLRSAFAERLELEMFALAAPAPLDLRVNTLKATRAAALAALEREGLKAEATALSPLGLRLGRRIDLGRCQALADGLVEPQDEGSQIAALLVDARPGQFVVDYCAGAGGKTLALAAAMQNRGRLVATDLATGRLLRAKARLKRAGAHNVETRDSNAERKWLKRQTGRVDRVLVDAPCTGIGSWRRIPDARWRLKPQYLEELVARQRGILAEAAKLVAPGGRLIYVTCSVLPRENEEQVAVFLGAHPGFVVVPLPAVWVDVIGSSCPSDGPYLQLTPARHGTGGFFIAIMERKLSA